jgi:hypothetical protein
VLQEEVGRKKKWVFKTVTESSVPGIVKKRMRRREMFKKIEKLEKANCLVGSVEE